MGLTRREQYGRIANTMIYLGSARVAPCFNVLQLSLSSGTVGTRLLCERRLCPGAHGPERGAVWLRSEIL